MSERDKISKVATFTISIISLFAIRGGSTLVISFSKALTQKSGHYGWNGFLLRRIKMPQ